MRTATHQFQCLVRQHGGDAGQGEKVKLDEIKDFAQKLAGMSFCKSVISGAQVLSFELPFFENTRLGQK